MNKKLIAIFILIAGVVLGIIASYWFYYYKIYEVQALENVTELEALSFKVYKDGNPASAVILMQSLIKKLEIYEKNSINADIYKADRSIAHGRLCILYKKMGKEDLAEKEYRMTISLSDPKCNQNFKSHTQNDLIEAINKIDSIKRR